MTTPMLCLRRPAGLTQLGPALLPPFPPGLWPIAIRVHFLGTTLYMPTLTMTERARVWFNA